MPEEPLAPTARPARPFDFLAFLLVVLAAQLGCALLLHLSRFGQDPPAALPLPTIVMFGLLAAGPLYPLARRLPRWRSLALPTALAACLAATWLLPPAYGGDPRYLLAPAAGAALTLALAVLPERRGAMLSAMSVYTVCTVLANYTFDSFLPVGDFFLVNVGTFFFGVTFTQRDRVHRFGRRNVYAMIGAAALLNVVMALTVGTPLRYVAVAFLAIVVSETADTEVYHRLLERPWLTRVASSNAISAPLDTIIFTVLAFAGESFATPGWMARVIVTDVAVKYGSSLLVALRVLRPGAAGERHW